MTATAHPNLDRTAEQRTAALRKANEVRSGRAAIKASIHDGSLDPRDVLWALPSPLDRMAVLEFLCSVRFVGQVKALGLCNRLGVSPARRLGRMSQRQRELLASLLPGGGS